MKRQKRNAYHHVIVSASKIDSNMAMICFQCLVVQTVKCVLKAQLLALYPDYLEKTITSC